MRLSSLFMPFLTPVLRRNGFTDDEIQAAGERSLNVKEHVFSFFWNMAHSPIACRKRMMYNMILSLPDRDAGDYASELEFLKKSNGLHVFPYAKIRMAGEQTKTGMDRDVSLPFVLHNGKKLFFPRGCLEDKVLESYRYFVETEGILGTGLLEKSPHSYTNSSFCVEEGDVLLDVGCSEGLFALDNVEKAAKVYLFETMKCWREPNNATFGPWKDKACVINKFVGSTSGRNSITLADAVKDESTDGVYFVKMDIEGGESAVIAASEAFFRSHKVKLACAAYHHQQDADGLSAQLERIGFKTSFSEGYMLPDMNGFVYPYFRRGMIYAKNY